ncbi:MAG: homoserine dehydrogenase [Candidatus Methylacidiphilales bacterium]|nr:homoserine dehydrogenase [Candidatus Methylacidiphilales bacterium]
MQQFGIGLVGCGIVGGGVVRHLQANRDLLTERCGARLDIVGVAVRDPAKARDTAGAPVTDDWKALVHNPAVSIVAELMGGTTTAREVAEATLRAGKSLVTANKALLADCGNELFALAEQHQASIYFEASVAGGIPIIKALREGLRANRILSIHGIINGTCNYILSRMAEEGLDYAEVLADAKRLGYAEADEALDVDGIDAAHKAAILASLAYGFWVRMDQLSVEGIRAVTALDMAFARKLGYTIKLLARIRPDAQNAVAVRVNPTLVPLDHVLASVSGVYNAVAVEGDVVGRTLFYGRGAGPDATASAVLGDLSEAAIDRMHGVGFRRLASHTCYQGTVPRGEMVSRFYVRLGVTDRPGVLARVADVFGRHRIGISSVFQPEGHQGGSVPLVMLLDDAREADFAAALAEIEHLDVVHCPSQVIRVEDFS